jgi:MFS family permease
MKHKQIKRTYYLLISLFWLATALPAALLVLLMQARGLNLFQVGIVMGAYSLVIVLLEVPTGGLADAVGRKRVAIVAYSFIFLSGVGMLIAFSFPAFLLASLLNGIGRALASGALDAWFVDALQAADPEIEIQPALAQAGTFTLLALGIGTLAGSAVPQLLPRIGVGLPADGTAVFTPLAIPIVLSLAVKLILIGAIILLVEEQAPQGEESAWRDGFRRMPQIVGDAFALSRRNPTIVLLLGATFASGLAIISMENFWQPHFAGLLGEASQNTVLFGVIMAGNFLLGMVGNMLATPLSRLLQKRYALVAAIFQGLRGLFLVGLALQTAVVPAVAFFWLVYLGMGVVNSPHAALINREIPADRRSAMLSVQSLAAYVGSALGSVGLGYLAEHASIGAAWIVAGAILMVSLLLYVTIDLRRVSYERQEPSLLETG